MTKKERLNKFKAFAGTVLSKDRVEEIIETVERNGPTWDNIWKLGPLLVASRALPKFESYGYSKRPHSKDRRPKM